MVAMAYLSIVGMITFSMFILEESIQMCVFGGWPAKNAKQWNLVLIGTDTMRSFNRTIKIINYSVGWLQPLAFFSYRAYAKATDYYIQGLESEVFAHRPDLFVGREVDFSFTPKRIETLDDGRFLLTNSKIGLIFDQRPKLGTQRFNGVVTPSGEHFRIDTHSIGE